MIHLKQILGVGGVLQFYIIEQHTKSVFVVFFVFFVVFFFVFFFLSKNTFEKSDICWKGISTHKVGIHTFLAIPVFFENHF